MSNYVQVRFQTSSSSIGTINHDFRLSKVNYLRDDMFHNMWKNEYFGYEPKKVKIHAKQSYNEYNQLFSDNHLAKYGKRRKITKGKQSDYLTGIVTLSNLVNDRLANGELSKDELEQCFVEAVDRVKLLVENEVGDELQLFSHVIHYDEKTPHMHFAFSNHTSQGEAVYYMLRTSKNNVLSKSQDEVGKAFNKIGFVRGEVKEKTNARHKGIRQMHQAEIKDLSANVHKLHIEKNGLDKIIEQKKLRLQEQINEHKVHKKEIKAHVKSLDLSATAAKLELDDIDIKIRELRDMLTYDKELMSDIKYVLEQYEDNDIDGTLSNLLSRINKVDMINNPEYKLEVSEMFSRFNERRLLCTKEATELVKIEEDIQVSDSVHTTSNAVHKKNK